MWITFLILCTTMRLYTEKEQLSTFFLRVCAQLLSFGRGQGKKPAPPAACGGRGETCGAGQKTDTQAERGETCGAGQKNGHTGRAARRGKADTQERRGKAKKADPPAERSEGKKQTHRQGEAERESRHTDTAERREEADTQAERGGGKKRTHRQGEAKQKTDTQAGRGGARKQTPKQSGAGQKNGHTGRAERKKRRRRGEAQKGLKNDLCKNRKIGYQSALFRE